MADAAGSSEQQESRSHIPTFPARHPMIPKLYVMPWKQDMKNRRLVLKNADLAGIPDAGESFCKLEHPDTPSSSSSSSSAPQCQTGLTFHRSSYLSRYNNSTVTTRRIYQT